MNCHDVEERLSAFAAGELADDEAGPVGEHLDGCSRCRAFLAAIEALDGLLADDEEGGGTGEDELRRRAALLREAVADVAPLPRGEVWTPEEVAAYLKLPVSTVFEMADELPFFSFAGQLRMRREALLAWMEDEERRRRLQGTTSWVRRIG